MDEETTFGWVDMQQLLLIVMLFILSVMTVTKKTDAEASDAGNVQIEAHWDDARDVDVDLWVRCPGDIAIGYSRKNGKHCDLLRDDLGRDPSEENYENVYSRGIYAGEYVVNAYLWRTDGLGPVNLRIVGRVRMKSGGMSSLFVEKITIDREKGETTVVRFTLNEGGGLLGTNHIPVALAYR